MISLASKENDIARETSQNHEHRRFLRCLLEYKLICVFEGDFSDYLALKTETLTKLACNEKWCLITLEAFFFKKETSNNVINLHNLQSTPAICDLI